MKILITGGAGYVGNELVYNLSINPEIKEIIIYDNLSRKNYNVFLDKSFSNKKIKFVKGELLDSRLLKKVLTGVDVVYHLAALVTTPFANEDPHLFEQINHWGTAELTYAIEESESVKKLVYLSSTSVYGVPNEIINIKTIPNPKTFYGMSKLKGEGHVLRLSDRIETIVLRCANIYGHSPSMRFDAVINRFMFEANFIGRISVTGNGKQHRAFINISNVSELLGKLANTKLDSGIYNLSGKNISIIEISNTIKDIYPETEILFLSQHLTFRELLVEKDHRLNHLITISDITFKDELLELKSKFSF